VGCLHQTGKFVSGNESNISLAFATTNYNFLLLYREPEIGNASPGFSPNREVGPSWCEPPFLRPEMEPATDKHTAPFS
jgi:hypothetical protein